MSYYDLLTASDETFLTCETNIRPLISLNQKIPQLEKVDGKAISGGKYILTFIVESKGEKIATIPKSVIVKGNKIEIKS